MILSTPLTDLLDIRHPIVLAPMATISGGALAAAVSEAGGLGLIGGGYGDPDWCEREWRAAGNARVGIGFITWRIAENPEVLDLALTHEPRAVMLSFDDCTPFADRIKRTGAKLICQVQTVAAARDAVAAGADVIVAQGTEAGGHGGTRATFPLVPAVVDAVDPVPVVAAGGIADGRGLAAALMLGASGALIGSRFYATAESLAHRNAKARAAAASGDDTHRGTVFDVARGLEWPGPWRIRTLRNAYLDRWVGKEDELAALGKDERKRFAAAFKTGDFDTAVVVAGEALDLIRDAPPAKTIVERIVQDAIDLMVGAPGKHVRVS